MADPAPARRAEALRALHVPGDPLVVVNAWDAASARVVAAAGSRAIATASWAIAAAYGVQDGAMPRGAMLAAVRRIVAAVSELPVTADLEAGYGETPNEVGATVAAALDVGVVGLNLEDEGRAVEDAASRVAAARNAGERAGVPVVINARVDPWAGPAEQRVTEAAARGRAYVAAGADCVFVIGASEPDDIARLVELIGTPVSVLARPGASVADLAALGVARISFGPGPLGGALAALDAAARSLLDRGAVPEAFGFRPPSG
jgi:2-methylisocitrate lyase-like PEP mutase family enzyme